MTDTEQNARYIAIIKARLTGQRFVHSLNVAESAEALAEQYGCSREKAYTAGLLHDVMKNAPEEEMRSAIQKADLVLRDEEKGNFKLWHAIAGSAYIQTELGITDPDIISAVRYHTTGRKNMSLLEKVIYIADFISADRDYSGIEEIRTAAYESLEKAMKIGLQFSIAELADGGKIIHPDSIDAYNQIIMDEIKEKKETKS